MNLEALRRAISPDTALVYLVNSCKPTGTWIGPAEIAEFVADVPPELLLRRSNSIVTCTFFKPDGLVGPARRLRTHATELSRHDAAEEAAIAALRDGALTVETVTTNERGRGPLTDALRARDFKYLAAATKFVRARDDGGRDTASKLLKSRFIVRPVDIYRLPEWLRISVDTEAQMRLLAKVLPSGCGHVEARLQLLWIAQRQGQTMWKPPI